MATGFNVIKASLLLLMMLLVAPQLEGAQDNFQIIKDKKIRTIRYIPNEPSGEALILVHGFSRNAKRMAGHSAGGALAFSTAIRAQHEGIEVAQLVLLDAVPWKETIKQAGQLQPLPLLSLTAESSAMNARLKVDELHAAIEFPFTQLHLVGSSHVDPENPPGVFAKSLTTETGQRLFAVLLKRYVLQEDFEAYVSEQEEMGHISR
jgi:hypothetical protein